MRYYKYCLFILSLVSIFACTEEETNFTESKTAVVTAYLFADNPVDSILISQSFSYEQVDTNIVLIDDLDIVLSDFENEYTLTSIGNGLYENLEVIIEEDKTYSLSFVWEEAVISSETYVPIKKEAVLSETSVQVEKIELGAGPPTTTEETDPIEITWDNTEGDYYYVVINNIEADPEYINESFAIFEEQSGGRRPFMFISEPNVMDAYRIDARRELTQFGTYEIIVYRVNPEYAALYESASNTTQSLEQPPTNIDNGLGIFTGVNSDTLYLEVEKL